MKYYAQKDINNFVIKLFNPYDEFDLAADIVEVTEASYAEAIASSEEITDYKVVAGALVLDTASQDVTILKEAKDKKIAELKVERLSRIQAIMPAIDDDATLEMMSELWKSIAGAARAPTVEWQSMIDIWTAAKQAGLAIKAMTILADVENYDTTVTPAWP